MGWALSASPQRVLLRARPLCDAEAGLDESHAMPAPFDLLLSVGQTLPCKVCNNPADLYGVVDFSKNCEEQRGLFLPLTGVPVYYHRCKSCGLIFTAVFDHWPMAYFADRIYNDGYAQVDPDYLERRPQANQALVADFVQHRRADALDDFLGSVDGLDVVLKNDHPVGQDVGVVRAARPQRHAGVQAEQQVAPAQVHGAPLLAGRPIFDHDVDVVHQIDDLLGQ